MHANWWIVLKAGVEGGGDKFFPIKKNVRVVKDNLMKNLPFARHISVKIRQKADGENRYEFYSIFLV